MEFSGSTVTGGHFRISQEGFTDYIPFRITVQYRPDISNRIHHLRLVRVIKMNLAIKRPDPQFGRVFPKRRVFEIIIEDIQPETIDTAIRPKAENAHHFGVNFRVTPIQVRLLAGEHVVIELPGLLIPEVDGFPGGVRDRIVVPRRQAKLVAILGPGIGAAAFRDDRPEVGV